MNVEEDLVCKECGNDLLSLQDGWNRCRKTGRGEITGKFSRWQEDFVVRNVLKESGEFKFHFRCICLCFGISDEQRSFFALFFR